MQVAVGELGKAGRCRGLGGADRRGGARDSGRGRAREEEKNLQKSLLHILEEKEDVLIDVLLCLLDTHTFIYFAGRPGPDTVTKLSLGFIDNHN